MTKPDDLVNSVYRGDGDGMYPGLTKRELFAAMIMQGLMTKNNSLKPYYAVAASAVHAADTLIKQLNENPYELD
jgi:hypothetical protein